MKSGDLVWGSDSPVSEELSTCRAGRECVSGVSAPASTWALGSRGPGGSGGSSALTHLAAVRRYDSEVGRDPVPAFHLHQIPDDDVLCIYAHLLTISNHQGLL